MRTQQRRKKTLRVAFFNTTRTDTSETLSPFLKMSVKQSHGLRFRSVRAVFKVFVFRPATDKTAARAE